MAAAITLNLSLLLALPHLPPTSPTVCAILSTIPWLITESFLPLLVVPGPVFDLLFFRNASSSSSVNSGSLEETLTLSGSGISNFTPAALGSFSRTSGSIRELSTGWTGSNSVL